MHEATAALQVTSTRRRHGPNVRSGSGIEESPGPGRGMQIESVIDIADVHAGDFANAGKPVPQGASVDMQGGGRFRIVATTFQVMAERKNQLRVFALVVVEECSQPFAHEPFDRASAMCGIDQAIETEFVERRGALGARRAQPNVQRSSRLSE